MIKNKIIFYLYTGLLTILMLLSAGMYFFNYQNTSLMFKGFGYPTYIIYPYGFAKLLGIVALWFFKGKLISEWAYAGFFFAFILAFFAHIMIRDGGQWAALIALVLLFVSYYFSKNLKAR
ncbi:MAG: DoxX family protein [Tenacibaculum sp.]